MEYQRDTFSEPDSVRCIDTSKTYAIEQRCVPSSPTPADNDEAHPFSLKKKNKLPLPSADKASFYCFS